MSWFRRQPAPRPPADPPPSTRPTCSACHQPIRGYQYPMQPGRPIKRGSRLYQSTMQERIQLCGCDQNAGGSEDAL